MKSKKGFTLVELVIVIAVIAILSAVLIPTFSNVISNANDSAAASEISNAVTEYTSKYAAIGEDYLAILNYSRGGTMYYIKADGTVYTQEYTDGVYKDIQKAKKTTLSAVLNANKNLCIEDGEEVLFNQTLDNGFFALDTIPDPDDPAHTLKAAAWKELPYALVLKGKVPTPTKTGSGASEKIEWKSEGTCVFFVVNWDFITPDNVPNSGSKLDDCATAIVKWNAAEEEDEKDTLRTQTKAGLYESYQYAETEPTWPEVLPESQKDILHAIWTSSYTVTPPTDPNQD